MSINQPKRVAVCLSGYTRTWKHCFESQKLFFGKYQTDFFLHIWENGTDVLGGNDQEGLILAYNPLRFSIEKRPDYRSFEKKVQSSFDAYRSSANLMYIAHGIREAISMARQTEDFTGIRYDFIVRARYDTLFNGDFYMIEPTMKLGTLYFPDQANYHRGYNDQLAIADSDIMEKFSEFFYWLPQSLQLEYQRNSYIGEIVLRRYIDSLKIPVEFRPMMYRILRPDHLGRNWNEIPENDLSYSRLRNEERVKRAQELKRI
jgi:hypothetical protein